MTYSSYRRSRSLYDDIQYRAVAEQVRAVQSRSVSALDLAVRVRRDIESEEPRIHAWVALSEDVEQHATAVDESPEALPLAGVSVGVKDIIDVEGLPTRAGTILTGSEPASSDAACVMRLRSLGAVVQGKTVTTEFAYLHPGPTRNPHALDRTPGGSSSGSAAAVGARTIPVALGSQTAGSLTRPAAYCGVAGLVLPSGSVDMAGVVGLSQSLDSLGLMTRTVDDLGYVHATFTTGDPPADTAAASQVRVWDGDGLADLAPEMSALVASVPVLMAELGVQTQRLDWAEHVRRLTKKHLDVMSYEALQIRHREYADHAAQLSEPLLELLRAGEKVSFEQHASILRYRHETLDRLTDHLGEEAVIVGPATPGPAPRGLQSTGVSVLSRAWQLLGLAVVVVPGARTPSGLPLGLQIIGLPGAESRMLHLGAKLEQALHDRYRW
ncbi:amidase [Mycolicibacterium mengxianglii]|uniref:amidase n=1 Tax=Mycolicibacterium mengxianglii TaxID=2736649 RepID=UPI0027DA2C03|nr:amidase [Mycolicibacterium mengxianglii]